MTSPRDIRLAALTLALAHRRSIELQIALMSPPELGSDRFRRLSREFDCAALEINQLDPDGSLQRQIDKLRCEAIVG